MKAYGLRTEKTGILFAKLNGPRLLKVYMAVYIYYLRVLSIIWCAKVNGPGILKLPGPYDVAV